MTSPYMLLIYATLLWGGNFAIGKALVEYIPPLTLSLARWAISLLVFLPFAWRELQVTYRQLREKPIILLVMSFTGVVGFNVFAYASLQYTTTINAALMNSLIPVVVAGISYIWLREKLNIRQWIGVTISLIGVVWIICDGNISLLLTFQFNSGDLIMLLAVFSWAIYSIVMKKYGSGLPQQSSFLITIGIAVVALIPLSIYEWSRFEPGWQLPPKHWLSLIYVGIFPSVISFICWNRAVLKVGPAKASTFLHLVVVFASLFSILFLGEHIRTAQVTGAILIFSGIYLVTKRSHQIRQTVPNNKPIT